MWSKADVSAVVYELVEDGEKQQELLDVVQGMSAEALETLPPQEMHDVKQLALRRLLRLQSAAGAAAQPQPGVGSELVYGTPIGDIIRGRLPNASKHMAHLLCDANDPSKGREAATVVSKDTLVTFAHETHGSWKIGKEVTVMVHDEHNSHRRPISCSVAGIDKILDVVALKAHESGTLVAPDVDSMLYAGLSYFLLGQSTQSDPSSVSHGVVSATQLDAHLHVRGDIQSGVGDSGGGVFATHSGKLIAMCVGADENTKKAVFAPIAPVLQFVNSLASTKV